MSNTFAVTAAGEQVVLSKTRQGTMHFTVANNRARPARGRSLLVPVASAESSWFRIIGDAEREFDPAQSHDFQVDITIPDSAPPGRYAFRLDVAAVQNPDEDYTTGPEVTFTLVEEPSPVPLRPAYGTTIAGTAIGGFAGLAAGGLIALVIGLILAAVSDDLGEAIGAVLIAMLLFIPGPWIGAAVGSWLALRMRGHQRGRRTGLLMAVIFPIWAVLTTLLLTVLSDAGLEGVPLYLVILLIMPLLWVLVPAISSRFLAIKLGREAN